MFLRKQMWQILIFCLYNVYVYNIVYSYSYCMYIFDIECILILINY